MDPVVPTAPSHKKQIITAVAVLVAIALIVIATVATTKKKDTTASTADSANTSTSNPASTTANTATYNDGTYSANASYQSPGGIEKVAVKLTIKGGVVTDSAITSTPTESEAKEYQDMFLSGYKSKVVGQSVDTIKLNRVSGSSLTSQGFNSALATIKQQAKS